MTPRIAALQRCTRRDCGVFLLEAVMTIALVGLSLALISLGGISVAKFLGPPSQAISPEQRCVQSPTTADGDLDLWRCGPDQIAVLRERTP